MTAISADLQSARSSAFGRTSPDGSTGPPRRNPPLRLDLGGGGNIPPGHVHHTSVGSSHGGPKLGMLTPHATNHQTAKASALQRGVDVVAMLDFSDPADDQGTASAFS